MSAREDLGPAVELLVRCADPTVDSGDDARIRSLLAADPDWERVLELARRHGVVPLVNRTLDTWYTSQVPGAVLSSLRERARSTAFENVRLADELHAIADRFETEGIRWLPFKGPVLAEVVYGDLTHRTFKDLDLLVHPDDLGRAVDLLEADGYERHLHAPRLDDSVLLGGPLTGGIIPEYTLRRSGIEVEVRCSVGDPNRPFTPEFETLWARRTAVEVAGSDVPALSPTDRLLVLAFHGTKHRWHLLKWCCDFAAAVASDDVDWSALQDRAERHGTERKLLVGCSLSDLLFGLDVLRDDQCPLQADDRATDLAGQTVDSLAAGVPARPSKIERTRYSLKASDSPADYLPILLSHGPLQPSIEMYSHVPLPGVLHPLYYLAVPLQFVAVHARTLLGSLRESAPTG